MVADLGEVQLQAGQYDAAARTLRRALRMPPDPRIPKTKTGESELTIKLYVHLGIALAGQGKPQDAIRQYHRALKHVPDHLEANNNLAKIYVEQKQNALAIRHLRRVVRVEPQRYEPHKVLGDLLRKEKEYAAAIAAWRGGLKARPDDPALLYEIAWQLATCPDPTARDGRQAVRTAERLCNVLGWDHVQALDTLAAAQAEVGEWATAVKTAQKALRLGREKGAAEFAREIERRLRLYEASKPYRE